MCVADLNHLLVTGCSNGNVIVWDTKTSVVQNVYVFIMLCEACQSFCVFRYSLLSL